MNKKNEFSSNKKNWFFSLLSGALLALSFPPMPFPFLSFVALIPLLYVLLQPNKLRYRYFLIYLTFISSSF